MKAGKIIEFRSSNNHSNQHLQKLQAAAPPSFKISNSKIRQKLKILDHDKYQELEEFLAGMTFIIPNK